MPRLLFRLALLAVLAGMEVPMIAAAETIGGAKAGGFSTRFVKPVALRYLIWMPQGKAPPGGWPLVIFLHGSGERGDDLHQTLIHGWPEMASKGQSFPFIPVAPQAPALGHWDVDALETLRRRVQLFDRVLDASGSIG